MLVGKASRSRKSTRNALREQVWRLGLSGHVIFLDGVTESELKAYYETASVFVIGQRTRGFCVPVVEAMALKVPIVAYGTTAVPHTVGDAGLVWDEPDPFLLAQSIDAVVRDVAVRRQLTERGWRRYQEHFTNRRIEREFLDMLRPHCSSLLVNGEEKLRSALLHGLLLTLHVRIIYYTPVHKSS